MGNGENTELLDLKMKTSESYNMASSHFFAPCGKDTSDDGGRGGDFSGSDIYDVVSSSAAAAFSSRPFNNTSASTVFQTPSVQLLLYSSVLASFTLWVMFVFAGGSMGLAPFTASQLQEFQRQSIIFKYIMASIPVPPYLLLPLPNNPSPAHLPQSNIASSVLDLKFSSGSDPEPWRCKRTDGKKWRCSRDVAPDQKYCERHTHKSKPRSRKPVEIHTNNNSSNRHPPPTPKSSSSRHSLQFPTVQLSAPSSDQTRCIEWLGRGDRSGTIPVVTCNQQQLMQSSCGMGFNSTDQNRRNTPAFQVQDEANQLYPMNFNQYMSNSINSSGQALGEQCLQDRGTTRDLIDSWSKDGLADGIISNNGSSFTSLTLSMSGWNHRPMDDDNEQTQVSIGMLDSERSSDEVLRSQWVNPVSNWVNSTAPGGPLGEALCLGNATNLPSPHGRHSNSTPTSSCSYGSCENSSYAFDFIG